MFLKVKTNLSLRKPRPCPALACKSGAYTQERGRSGEEVARVFLKQKGYRILEKNYRNRLGEIDLIAKDKDILCFIEVKTRYSDKFGLPEEAITPVKKRHIFKVALAYLKRHNLLDNNARFDVVSVIYSANIPKIELIKDAFEFNY